MKKIAIDISQMIYGTGVSVYTQNLLTALFEIDHENKYLLFGGSLRRKSELRDKLSVYRNAEVKINSISPRMGDFIWNRLHVLPIEKLIGEVDILHTSDWTEPPSKAYKVTTIHDLSPLVVPEHTNKRIVQTFERKLYWVQKETQKIIVPTKTTKEDLLRHGFDEKKIEVIYEGLDPVYKEKMKAKRNYLLAVGTAKRKNLANIISAFKKLKEKGIVENLLVTGSKPDIQVKGVTYLGFVPNNEFVRLYAGAQALVYPSFYEGFGLPILEAFSQDCPVVTSNIGSMKEVAGNAAVLVNPNNVDSIADGIKQALKNEETWGMKGRTRLKDFDWNKAAYETLKIYNQA